MIFLEFALRSAVLIAAAAGALWLLRGQSAARRHALCLLTLVALLALPALLFWAPQWTSRWTPAPQLQAWPAPLRTVIQVTAEDAVVAPERTASVFTALWLAGALWMLARVARAQVAAHRLVRESVPFPGAARLSPSLSVPMAFGLLQPVIVLPAAARAWPAGQVASVLAHERMHLARGDNWWQLLAQLVAALYWPQPLVWWLVSRMHKECEQACDDGVLVAGTPPSEYAGYLVTIGRTLASRAVPAGGIAMTRTSQLQSRVAALLDPSTCRRPASLGFLGSAAVAMTLVLAAASFQTPLLAQAAFSGVVRDSSGGVVPKARIDLQALAAEGLHEVVYSSPAGEFSIPNVADGAYTLTVAAPGFAKLTLTGLKFENAKARPLDLVLNVGMIQERVQVSAASDTPAAAPAPTGPPKRIRVGGNVQAAKLVSKARPLYPPTAKADRVEGTVLLRAVIGLDGAVVSLEQVNRTVDARLAESAKEAVKQWRYSPTLLNGNPVEIVTEIEVNYTLMP